MGLKNSLFRIYLRHYPTHSQSQPNVAKVAGLAGTYGHIRRYRKNLPAL